MRTLVITIDLDGTYILEVASNVSFIPKAQVIFEKSHSRYILILLTLSDQVDVIDYHNVQPREVCTQQSFIHTAEVSCSY